MAIPEVSLKQIGLLRNEYDSPTKEDFYQCGQEIYKALFKFGFVHLVDHGVDKDLVSDAFEGSKNFFQLPMDVKCNYTKDPQLFDGYVAPGAELFDQSQARYEIRESFNMLQENSPRLPPDEVAPNFKMGLVNLAHATDRLTRRLLTALSLALDLRLDQLDKWYGMPFTDKNYTTLRSLYYPSITGPVESKVVRLGEHTDYGPLTLLYQDPMGGLQVHNESNDQWVTVVPVQDAILLNLGDLLEILTSGCLPSTRHRVVVMPEDEAGKKRARQSLAFFVHFDHDVLVSPIPPKTSNMVHPKNIGKTYEPVVSMDYVKGKLNAIHV